MQAPLASAAPALPPRVSVGVVQVDVNQGAGLRRELQVRDELGIHSQFGHAPARAMPQSERSGERLPQGPELGRAGFCMQMDVFPGWFWQQDAASRISSPAVPASQEQQCHRLLHPHQP